MHFILCCVYVSKTSDMEERKTKGYTSFYDRKMCEDCKWRELVGEGSNSQKWNYCTKIEPNFEILPEDICDEFEPE